jgi:hypothetical protein
MTGLHPSSCSTSDGPPNGNGSSLGPPTPQRAQLLPRRCVAFSRPLGVDTRPMRPRRRPASSLRGVHIGQNLRGRPIRRGSNSSPHFPHFLSVVAGSDTFHLTPRNPGARVPAPTSKNGSLRTGSSGAMKGRLQTVRPSAQRTVRRAHAGAASPRVTAMGRPEVRNDEGGTGSPATC